MEQVIEFVSENIAYILLSAAVVIANIFNKPKTAEKLKKAKEKQKAHLEAKCAYDIEKLKKDNEALEKIKKELEKNA